MHNHCMDMYLKAVLSILFCLVMIVNSDVIYKHAGVSINLDEVISRIKSMEIEVSKNAKLETEINGLKMEVKGLKTEINGLKTEIGNLKTNGIRQNQKIVDQEAMIVSIKDILRLQTKKMVKQEGTISDIKGKMKMFQSGDRIQRDTRNKNIFANLTKVESTNGKSPKGHKTLSKFSNIKRLASSDVVAFYGVLQNDLTDLPGGYVLKFKTIHINRGNAFNGNDGVFVCPVSGLYMFHWRGMAFLNKEMYLNLIVNGQPYVPIYAYSYNRVFHADSETAFVHASAGDHVWVATQGISSPHGGYTSFSGVLLFPD